MSRYMILSRQLFPSYGGDAEKRDKSTYHDVGVRQHLVWWDPAVLLKDVSHARVDIEVLLVPTGRFAGIDVLLCGGHRGVPAKRRIQSIKWSQRAGETQTVV